MVGFLDSVTLFFVLLNPFLMSIYLMDLIQELGFHRFMKVLFRGALIAGAAFCLFCVVGERFFTDVLHVRFASFLIFGGIIFLIIGIRFVMQGSESIRALRGKAEYVEGSVAMPFMIGPATVSASVLTGSRLSMGGAILAVVVSLTLVVVSLLLVKFIHDRVKARNEKLVERYIEITGRVMALVIGTYAVEMIISGMELIFFGDGSMPQG